MRQYKPAAIHGRLSKREESPEDLLGNLVFLCSADSDFMTGQVITVDGGANNTA